jgi:catechol 2,3-dioxygenase-like lactoylglutathione lyase family enzyme
MSSRPIDFQPLVPELVCADFRASLTFYRDLLGFTRLYGRGNPDFAYLERERAQLMLEQHESDGSWLTGPLERPFGRGLNLQIEASDLAPMLGALARAGWPLYRAPEEAWYRVEDRLEGQRQFLVQDPDGYLLRFCQALGSRALDAAPAGGRVVR